MKKTNNPMDEQSLQEQNEEVKFKLLMARFAEMEGKKLQEENEQLGKDSFYLPSAKEKKSFLRRLNVRFALYYLKNSVRSLSFVYSKAAVTFLLVTIILFTTVMSVESVQVKVLNMFIQVQKEYKVFWFDPDTGQSEEIHFQEKWDYAYMPMQVPEGYRITEVKNFHNYNLIKYENGDQEDHILFQENRNNIRLNMNTEDADEVIHTTIQGVDGLVVLKGEKITVNWQNETSFFSITANVKGVDKEELIDMAESIAQLRER